MYDMIGRAKITAQGQLSIPAEVRKELGVGPGATVQFDKVGDVIVVRRVGKRTLADVRAILASKRPSKPKTLAELTAGIEKYIRDTHARR